MLERFSSNLFPLLSQHLKHTEIVRIESSLFISPSFGYGGVGVVKFGGAQRLYIALWSGVILAVLGIWANVSCRGFTFSTISQILFFYKFHKNLFYREFEKFVTEIQLRFCQKFQVISITSGTYFSLFWNTMFWKYYFFYEHQCVNLDCWQRSTAVLTLGIGELPGRRKGLGMPQ